MEKSNARPVDDEKDRLGRKIIEMMLFYQKWRIIENTLHMAEANSHLAPRKKYSCMVFLIFGGGGLWSLLGNIGSLFFRHQISILALFVGKDFSLGALGLVGECRCFAFSWANFSFCTFGSRRTWVLGLRSWLGNLGCFAFSWANFGFRTFGYSDC
jgi:hypothetical protein